MPGPDPRLSGFGSAGDLGEFDGSLAPHKIVMAGLGPAIHEKATAAIRPHGRVDARIKSGHDDSWLAEKGDPTTEFDEPDSRGVGVK